MSYIGIIGASRLDPECKFNHHIAQQMERKRSNPIDIKVETGWERGRDGIWRFEIPDPFMNTVTIEDYVKPRFGEAIRIELIMNDLTIIKAYPEFEELKLYAMYSPRKGTVGYYSPATNGMVVSMGKPNDKFDYQIEGVLLHEIQHLIQEIEDFARGGSPKEWGRSRYHRLAGEVEARNICHRHFLSEEERSRTLRISTQDVPDNNQIVTFE